jgi:hypothetical protein
MKKPAGNGGLFCCQSSLGGFQLLHENRDATKGIGNAVPPRSNFQCFHDIEHMVVPG